MRAKPNFMEVRLFLRFHPPTASMPVDNVPNNEGNDHPFKGSNV